MLDYLGYLTVLDVALIASISLFAGLMLRRWSALAWAALAAMATDFTLPFLFHLITGDGATLAWAEARRRHFSAPGGVMILRTACYFALIATVFAVKAAWRRR